MARLSFCLFTLLLLLSFSVSETRPLRNHGPFSFHFPATSSLFLCTVKHYLYSGSKGRSLAKIDHKILKTSAKVSFSIGFRESNATRNRYFKPLRVSPGGPDAHHHFKVTATGGHGRRQNNCVHELRFVIMKSPSIKPYQQNYQQKKILRLVH